VGFAHYPKQEKRVGLFGQQMDGNWTVRIALMHPWASFPNVPTGPAAIRGRHEGDAGTASARVEPGDVGYLYAGVLLSEAPGPKPSRSALARVTRAARVLRPVPFCAWIRFDNFG
jgi:hypothetical protein